MRIAIEDFIEGIAIGERITNWIKSKSSELRENGFGNSWHVIMQQLEADADVPALFSKDSPHAILALPALIPMLIGALIGLGFSFVSVIIQPIAQRVLYKVNHKWGAYRIDPVQATKLLKMWPEKSAQWLAMLADLGVDENNLDGLQALIVQRLTELQYIALWRRGIIGEGELTNRLHQLGMLDPDIENLKGLTEVIPTPQDLIYMQVREAFNDEFSQRFQHDEGDKSAVTEWAGKQGLSADWVDKYWRAHWQLPSPNQVFEMLHRLRPGKTENTIETGDVDAFLKAADYSPFWRERLKEISYSVFTRVDIRRMYKMGVLNEQEVKEAYLDAGYDDKRADALTKFTIAFEAEEESGIVRSSVTSAYADGMIDRATAEKMLSDGGYDKTSIGFYLDNVDFKEALDVQKIKLANIKKQFIEGILNESSVHSKINELDLPAERITALLELWTTERNTQVTLLTITQMETLLEKGIVTQDDYKTVAKQRGYNEQAISWTLERIAQEASEKAQKDAEKQQSDNERIQKSTSASKYQKDKSQIDLTIAQTKAEITDIDVAMQGKLNEQNIRDLKARLENIDENIEEIQVSQAEYKAEIVSIDNRKPNETDETVIAELDARKDELQQASADAQIEIEKLQSEKASIDAALKGVLTSDLIVELNARKAELKDAIARLNVKKAQLRFDYQTEITKG